MSHSPSSSSKSKKRSKRERLKFRTSSLNKNPMAPVAEVDDHLEEEEECEGYDHQYYGHDNNSTRNDHPRNDHLTNDNYRNEDYNSGARDLNYESYQEQQQISGTNNQRYQEKCRLYGLDGGSQQRGEGGYNGDFFDGDRSRAAAAGYPDSSQSPRSQSSSTDGVVGAAAAGSGHDHRSDSILSSTDDDDQGERRRGGSSRSGRRHSSRSIVTSRGDDYLARKQQDYWEAVERRRAGQTGGGTGSRRSSTTNATTTASAGRERRKSAGGGYSVAADASVGSSSSVPLAAAVGYSPSSSSDAPSGRSTSLVPLPGFEEADLLQRAIERRALLHDRIAAMEAAQAGLRKEDHNDVGGGGSSGPSGGDPGARRRRSASTSMRHPPPERHREQDKQRERHQHQQQHEQHEQHEQQQQWEQWEQHKPPTPGHRKVGRKESHLLPATTQTRTVPPVSDGRYAKPFDEAHEDDDDDVDTAESEDEDDRHSGGLCYNSYGKVVERKGGKKPARKSLSDHHERMNELSERIKREAQEFMNFESSYADEKRRLMEGGDSRAEEGEGAGWRGERGDGDGMARSGSEHSFRSSESERSFRSGSEHSSRDGRSAEKDKGRGLGLSPSAPPRAGKSRGTPGKGSAGDGSVGSSSSSKGSKGPRRSPVRTDSASAIDSSAWGGDSPPAPPPVAPPEEEEVEEIAGPTPQQMLRYTNMIRLGIPDVAVLRSMERDGIEDARGTLRELKEKGGPAPPPSPSGRAASRRSSSLGVGSRLEKFRAMTKSVPAASQRDRQDIWESRGLERASELSSSSADGTGSSESSSAEAGGSSVGSGGSRRRRNGGEGEGASTKEVDGGGGSRSTMPLSEDPNYSKYFKMLKAKVPRSWVKRVLEVDGKDSRVLDLDPDRPLAEQVNSAEEESGNNSVDDVSINHKASSTDNSDTEQETHSSTGADVSAETLSSVKAELAAMTAKAAQFKSRLRSAPSDESNEESGEPIEASQGLSLWKNVVQSSMPASHAGADITSAAVAASNERMARLRALRSGGKSTAAVSALTAAGNVEVGRRRQTHDEIRQRATAEPTSSDGRRTTYPESKERGSVGGGKSVKSSYDNIPLKDDPRFSKYFQMIRSRVPRSWVERVIEVDDRDPAILDLDPNKSLASQIGEDGAQAMPGKDDSDTVDSTDGSMDGEKNGLSRSTKKNSLTPIASGEESDQKPPIAQIDADSKETDDQSEASSITTTLRDEKPASTIDLAKISTFLDRMEAQMEPPDNKDKTSRRTSTNEHTEDRLAALLSAFDSKKRKEEQVPKDDRSREENRLAEKSQSDITKLSALLATKIASNSITPREVAAGQSDLADLPPLLSEVLEKMEDSNETTTEPDQKETNKDSAKKELEALLAKRLSKEEVAQPKILCEDPEYAKYFKMLKLGLPRESVIRAMKRDGKDVTVIDLDPNLSLAEQKNKKHPEPSQHAALENLLSKRATEIKEKEEAPNRNEALEGLMAKRAATNKTAALEALCAKKADAMKEKEETPNKHAALNGLLAKRAADADGAKVEMGIPAGAVRQALQKEGKDPNIVDMDPEKSYASQTKKENEKEDTDPPIKEEYVKFFKMLKMGIPPGAVQNALKKEGKDPEIINMDPERSYASQVKTEEVDPPIKEEYAKFFKMLKMGIPPGAVQNALKKEGKDPEIINMDPERSYASQAKTEEADPPIKEEYAKFFKMLKMGLPVGAVQNALKKEGKDPEIINMDPDKSYASQVKGAEKDAGLPLKDDPEYTKFFKMLKMGIPMGAVQNALKKEGKDPEVINFDPEISLSSQKKPKSPENSFSKQPAPVAKLARKRLHWNKIDESKLHHDSFWNQAKDQTDLQLVGLDIDNEEFASLFTASLNKAAAPKKENPEVKKQKANQKVQLIDGRRRMNGSILLKKFKVNPKMLAKKIDNMETIEADPNEIRGMMQLLPTKDESLALRSYLPPPDAPEETTQASIDKLGECEQYMAVMLDVPDAKDKFQAILFRSEFETLAEHVRDGAKLLVLACDSVISSERFRKLLLYALKLGNALNTGGANEEVTAITLDSLLKLAEAKAFDRQTSVLHYLVSIVLKNDEDVLKVSEDLVPLKAAERVAMDMLAQHMREMGKGIELVKDVVMRNLPRTVVQTDEMLEDELLGSTPMGKFSLSAASKIRSLSSEFDNARDNFTNLLQFFAEDQTMTPEAFFSTINTFVSTFDQTHKELKKKEEAKERKKRIEEKRKLREQEMATKRIKS